MQINPINQQPDNVNFKSIASFRVDKMHGSEENLQRLTTVVEEKLSKILNKGRDNVGSDSFVAEQFYNHDADYRYYLNNIKTGNFPLKVYVYKNIPYIFSGQHAKANLSKSQIASFVMNNDIYMRSVNKEKQAFENKQIRIDTGYNSEITGINFDNRGLQWRIPRSTQKSGSRDYFSFLL